MMDDDDKTPAATLAQDTPWFDEACLNNPWCRGDSCCRYSDRFWKNQD